MSIREWIATNLVSGDVQALLTPQMLVNASGVVFFFFLISAIGLLLIVSGSISWAIWLTIGAGLTLFQLIFSFYNGVRIVIDLFILAILKLYLRAQVFLNHTFNASEKYAIINEMKHATTYREWVKCSRRLDQLEHSHNWIESEDGLANYGKVLETIDRLRRSRESGDFSNLLYEMPGIIKRNHLGIDDYEAHAHCLTETKQVIIEFGKEVQLCLDYIRDLSPAHLSTEDKVNFFQGLSRNLGHTALCLSGGGSLAMYHLGVIKALIESGNYKNIRVISGTSGGSIGTAMCACMTEEELLKYVLVENVSTDYRGNGEMARQNVCWFPPLMQQAMHFTKHGTLVDNDEFDRCCYFYWGDKTFAEAYAITRKHVCISVTASNVGGSAGGPAKLLLNHISTPNVLLRSAVQTSCSLPGIMKPNHLKCKNSNGEIVPFGVDGVQWLDGSIQADVPFRRLSSLFSVSNFIVSQVNFHVLPFIDHKVPGKVGKESSLIKNMLSALDLDLRHRSVLLSKMGLLPKLYGHDITNVFRQKYHGDVTIVPRMRIEDSLGVKAIMNPTCLDMQVYLKQGRKAAWPHLTRIRHMLTVEAKLWSVLENLSGSSGGGGFGKQAIVRQLAMPSKASVSDLSMYAVPTATTTQNGPSNNSTAKDEKEQQAALLILELQARVRNLEMDNQRLERLVAMHEESVRSSTGEFIHRPNHSSAATPVQALTPSTEQRRSSRLVSKRL